MLAKATESMSKLYFRYAAMNAGKSTNLLQVAHNYEERGRETVIYTSAIDNRAGDGIVASRLCRWAATRPTSRSARRGSTVGVAKS